MAEVRGQLLEGEALRDAALAPGLRPRLEPSHQKLAGVLLEVRAGIGVTQDRQAGCKPGNGLRHDIEVLGRVQRHRDIRPTAHFTRPRAGAVHDDLRAHLPLFGRDTGDRPARGADRRDLEVLEDANAGVARARGERAGRVDRVGLSVLRQKHRAHQAIDAAPQTSRTDTPRPRPPTPAVSAEEPSRAPAVEEAFSPSLRRNPYEAATAMEPTCLKPVAWPVSRSSPS